MPAKFQDYYSFNSFFVDTGCGEDYTILYFVIFQFILCWYVCVAEVLLFGSVISFNSFFVDTMEFRSRLEDLMPAFQFILCWYLNPKYPFAKLVSVAFQFILCWYCSYTTALSETLQLFQFILCWYETKPQVCCYEKPLVLSIHSLLIRVRRA